jgi:hypothetical protein
MFARLDLAMQRVVQFGPEMQASPIAQQAFSLIVINIMWLEESCDVGK